MVRAYPKPFAPFSAGCPVGRRRAGFVNRHWIWIILTAWLAGAGAVVAAEPGAILGLPFSRFYAFEEIGNASRGARLGFDALGRLAVTNPGSYVVLNDNTWTDIAEKNVGGIRIQQVVFDPAGRAYYGAFGSWGLMEFTAEGRLAPRPLLPKSYPKWVMASNFMDIFLAPGGVFFCSFNGVAYWDRASNRHVFFEVPQMARLLMVHGQAFAWSHRIGLQRLDLEAGTLVPVSDVDVSSHRVDQVVSLDDGRVLAATMAGRLLVFDGKQLTPWSGPLAGDPSSRITALQRLADGNLAIAISGRGLYIVTPVGEILSSYTSTEYHRIIELAAREPGVLWAETENGVEKVLYDSAVTVFGQRVGLPISWPQVVRWRNRVVVASGGRLYETVPHGSGEAARFELIGEQPTGEIWALAAKGDRLLAGNSSGIFARQADGRFTPVLTGFDVARLVMVGDDLCFAIGMTETAVLRWQEGTWTECAGRVPATGYPSVVLATGHAAWAELAANRVVRFSLRDGQLRAQVFEHFPWEPAWINIGLVGDTVVLSAPPKGRVYYNEKTEAFVPAPEIDRLLDAQPYPIARLREDDTGTLWASYEQGLLMLRSSGAGQPADRVAFNVTNDRFPFIHLLPGGDVWMSTGQSLYRVDRRRRPQAEPAFHPMIVSVIDAHTGREVFSARDGDDAPLRLAYAQSNLLFRFFAGSYGSRRSPTYEFKLNRGLEAWAPLAAGSVLTLNGLREGNYHLAVRLAGTPGTASSGLTFDFAIAPPWYRTWYAYTLYGLGAIFVVLVLIRLSVYRTRARNVVLEKMVQERTDELRAAMAQLNEETRNAATVAERNRLAGEIHDSLQQGLSGLILQLDATLKLPGLSADLRSRLNVARNMVSFTRHEVQHAVWDMESPLLDDAELGTALHKMAALISPGTPRVDIKVVGSSAALSSATKHHLLRMAQEAITNAVRHAAARTISIVLTCEAGIVSLSITDDGNGFVPAEVLSNGIGHFGLRGLRGRAAKIGGDIQIRSAPGEGTSIRIAVQGAAHVDLPRQERRP
jgi:signal transduction histidine kinase